MERRGTLRPQGAKNIDRVLTKRLVLRRETPEFDALRAHRREPADDVGGPGRRMRTRWAPEEAGLSRVNHVCSHRGDGKGLMPLTSCGVQPFPALLLVFIHPGGLHGEAKSFNGPLPLALAVALARRIRGMTRL